MPDPRKDPSKTIEEGHLHFTLEGDRMKGEWVMFRLKPKPGEKAEPWMLKKVTDDFADPGDGDALVDNCVTSVTTGRTMAEIAAGEDVWRSNRGGQKGGRAKKAAGKAPPPFEEPQLATLVDEVPPGNSWIHEYKYDGYRLLLAVGDGVATAWTRNGKDWSDKFKALVKAAARLPAGCLIDGEAVAVDDQGRPSFQLLQSTLKDQKGANLVFYAFDLLIDRGKDIRKLPNIERKQRLAALLEGVSPPILYGDHVIGRGEELFREVCKTGGEGIVSKRASAPYRGTRTRDWLKVKCTQRQEFVIVGWSESDKRIGFRSLLLAAKEHGKLTYVGKVGTGFNARLIQELIERMEPLAIDKAPVEVPRADRKGAHWIRPELVAEIAFSEFTDDGILRHPSFIALREDKPAKDVVREVPKHLSVRETKPKRKSPPLHSQGRGTTEGGGGAPSRRKTPPSALRAATSPRKRGEAKHASAEDFGIEISSPERVIFPELGLTKKDLADYYATIEPLIMIDAAKRPMTLIRCPGGRTGECFFQKHDKGTFGPHVKHIPIEESNGAVEDYLYFEDIKGLLASVQMGTVEFHGWGSKVDKVEYPDRLVFDLDPDVGLDFGKVKGAAVRLKALLEDLGLKSFPLLSGGKGIHVVVPLDQSKDWPTVKSFADRFSRAISEAEPQTFTANIRKVQRKGRIFLDWLRNQRGATAVMPYSARAREGAPASAPIAWEELDRYDSGHHFSIRDADELLERASSKMLKGWGEAKQALPEA